MDTAIFEKVRNTLISNGFCVCEEKCTEDKEVFSHSTNPYIEVDVFFQSADNRIDLRSEHMGFRISPEYLEGYIGHVKSIRGNDELRSLANQLQLHTPAGNTISSLLSSMGIDPADVMGQSRTVAVDQFWGTGISATTDERLHGTTISLGQGLSDAVGHTVQIRGDAIRDASIGPAQISTVRADQVDPRPITHVQGCMVFVEGRFITTLNSSMHYSRDAVVSILRREHSEDVWPQARVKVVDLVQSDGVISLTSRELN